MGRQTYDLGFLGATPTNGVVRDLPSADQLKKWYWDNQLSVPEISRLSGTHRQTLYEDLASEQRRLRTAGLMLYWAEGAKQGHVVDFTNSDLRSIQIFLLFMREICGVAEARLRGFLYIYEGQDAAGIQRYWSRLTRIPEPQFLKPYISKLRPDRLRRRVLTYGVMHIRYNDKRLLQQILLWIQKEADILIARAGTQAANGA